MLSILSSHAHVTAEKTKWEKYAEQRRYLWSLLPNQVKHVCFCSHLMLPQCIFWYIEPLDLQQQPHIFHSGSHDLEGRGDLEWNSQQHSEPLPNWLSYKVALGFSRIFFSHHSSFVVIFLYILFSLLCWWTEPLNILFYNICWEKMLWLIKIMKSMTWH